MMIGGAAGFFGGTAADSFKVCAILAVIVAVVSVVYFAKVKSPKAASEEADIQAA